MEGTTTITISDKKTKVYLGIDNLNAGSEVVDLSDRPVAERNWYSSAVHMVYNETFDGPLDLAGVGANVNLRQVGDSNGDGKVNIKDATAIQKHLAEIIVMDNVSANISDTDNDYKLTIRDATAIQKKIAGLM